MRKYVLGLDIGVTSVGWGIIDLEKNEPVCSGVRLFSESTAENNVDRRGFRSSRRLLRRRSFRLEQIKNLFIKNEIVPRDFFSKTPIGNPYEMRVRGLTQKLSYEELVTVVLHIAKRRGIDNIEIIEDDKELEKEQGETTKMVNENDVLLKGKYICQLQLERLQSKDKKIRGIENRFRTSQYIDELSEIFRHQDIAEDLKEKIISIVKRRRAYYDGPGSKNSPTPYGQWFYENGELQHIGMIDKMKGRCSLFPEEFRAPKMSYTACLFNLLNDLNNLNVQNRKISPEQKKDIIAHIVNEKGELSPQQLSKYLGVDINEISGFRINKSGDPLLTGFGGSQQGMKDFTKQTTGYKKLLTLVKKGEISKNIIENKEYVDRIFDVLSAHKDKLKRIEEIKRIDTNIFTQDNAEKISRMSGINGYHALSYKAMRLMMNDLIETSKNQMQIITEGGLKDKKYDNLKNRSTIPYNDDAVYSPVARRALHESIKVINAVRKKYGELDSIVIEMPRDRNSEEEKMRKRKEQKRNEEQKKDIDELLGEHNLTLTETQRRKLNIKIRLYKEQDAKCLYTGKPIDLKTLIADRDAYEVDHIIPISISFDDSLNNKTLCLSVANQEKGQRTPYQYLSSGNTSGLEYTFYKKFILSLRNLSRKKREYLLCENDITKYSVQKDFINRNLVDTQYTSRALLNHIMTYFRANEIPTKIHTIRGVVTSTFRKRARIEKDRDESFHHHAVDALIVAGIKKMQLFDHVLAVSLQKVDEETVTVHSGTGEVLTIANENEYFDSDFLAFVKHLRDTVKDTVKYSHKIDRKPNRNLSDQTIYGVHEIDGDEHTIKKYSDIYNDAVGEKVKKLFQDEKAEESLLMARHDPLTFQLLKKIVNEYSSAKNPFSAYRNEHGYIRKLGRSSGPIVQSLRYDGGALGSALDISHKYQNGKGGKVVKLQLVPYRIDIYKTSAGQYKFLRVRNSQIRKNKDGRYEVLSELYTAEKKNRQIDENDQFCFSLYKNDIFECRDISGKSLLVRMNGQGFQNNIEYKPIDRYEPKQLFLSIGKKTKEIVKYSTDVLGNRYRIERETCQMVLPVL